MDRVQFLQTRIEAIKRSIQHNRDLIALYNMVPDADAEAQAADIAELERRISIDQDLLTGREKDLAAAR